MDLVTLFAFTIAYAVTVLVPGPGVAAIVARALGGGFGGAVPMVLGILVGDFVYLIFAVFGLAAIAHYFGAIFVVIRFAGAAYLLYVAWKFWTARPGAEQIRPKMEASWGRTLMAGLSLTLGNPKTIAFYLALLPTVVPLDRVTPFAFAELSGIVVVVLLVIGCAYALLASMARELFRSPRAIGRLNKTVGVVMATAAALVVVR